MIPMRGLIKPRCVQPGATYPAPGLGGPGVDLIATTSKRALLVGAGDFVRDLESLLQDDGWICQRAESTSGVLRRVHDQPDLDLVLLIPGDAVADHVELCRHIKFDARTAFLSVVFLLASDVLTGRAAVLAAGPDDCIRLPAQPDELLLRLSSALRAKRATDSLEDATAVITSLANAIEGRDAYTRGHVERVSTYAVEMGRRVGVPADDLAVLRIGGVVHDIGKVAVPDHILNKPGKLTDEEIAIVQRHPVVGHDILQPLRTFRRVLPLVRWHHERPNGRGYPDGLRGDEVPLLARIVAVADVFDALNTARSYRPAFPPPQCRAILLKASADGDLDAELVTVLLDMLDQSASALGAVVPDVLTASGMVANRN